MYSGGHGACMRCAIVGEETIKQLIKRYDGLGKPLTNDEREILLFALYNESEARGGIVAEAQRAYLKKIRDKV